MGEEVDRQNRSLCSMGKPSVIDPKIAMNRARLDRIK